MELSDLATMPLRIEVSRRGQPTDSGWARAVTTASIYRLPRGATRSWLLLLGPVGVPGKPDATWSELLRCIADALELKADGPKVTPPHEPTECNNTKCPACLEIVKLRAEHHG